MTDTKLTISRFDCMFCGYGPKDGVTTYRQGPKGTKAPWACLVCARDNPPQEVKEFVAILESANQAKQ